MPRAHEDMSVTPENEGNDRTTEGIEREAEDLYRKLGIEGDEDRNYFDRLRALTEPEELPVFVRMTSDTSRSN